MFSLLIFCKAAVDNVLAYKYLFLVCLVLASITDINICDQERLESTIKDNRSDSFGAKLATGVCQFLQNVNLKRNDFFYFFYLAEIVDSVVNMSVCI